MKMAEQGALVSVLSGQELARERISRYARITQFSSLIATIVGAMVMIAWTFDIGWMKSVVPGLVTMKFNTALGFCLLGIALYCLKDPAAAGARRVLGLFLAWALLLLVSVTLGVYFFGANLGLDEWFVSDPASTLQGRMSTITAVCFVLLSLALIFINIEWRERHAPSQYLAAMAGFGALFALEGYFFGVKAPDQLFVFPSVALHTAVLFLVLTVGILSSRVERGFLAVIASPWAGGSLARRALPWIVLLQIAIAWLRLQGQRAGYYETEIGLAIFATSNIFLFAGLVWWAAHSLNRLHVELEARNLANAQYAAIVQSSADAIIGKTLGGVITSWNPGAEKIFGYSEAEMVGQLLTRLIPVERQREEEEILARLGRGETVDHFETVRCHKDGHSIHVSVTSSPIRDVAGRVIGASKVVRDISERKVAEAALLAVMQENEEFKTALDEHAIVAITDLRGRITYVNDKFCRISQYSREELLGQDHRLINSGYHPKEFISNLWSTIGQGCVWRGEVKNKAKDGTFYWVDATIVPVLAADGKPRQYMAIKVDITELKRTEAALASALRETNQFKIALDQHAIVAITDPQGKITYANDRFCQISKYAREELIGQDHRIINSGHHSKEFFHELWATVGRGEIWRGEIKNRAKDSSIYWVDTAIIPFLDETGRPRQYMAIRIVITATKLAQEDLARSNKDLEQFAYVASHDLQEPLRAVAGCLQILQRRYEGKLDPGAVELIGHSVDGAYRMQSLIEGLLAFSRVGTTAGQLEMVKTDLVLDTALKNLAMAVKDAGATITRDPLPNLRADPLQLTLLFQNLLSNALKFRGKVPPQIQIRAERDNNGWNFSVADNGIGIDEKFFDRIFIIFQRLHTRTEFPGTGLGLAICKKITERHGGRMWVESKLGQGSTFYFRLPDK